MPTGTTLQYHYFHDVLLDMHFSGLTYCAQPVFSDPDMHPLDFSLLNRREDDEEPEDDVLMQKAAGAYRRRPLLTRTEMKLSPRGYGGHDGG